VIPLMPAPIVQQEGPEKNAWERTAANRCITTLRQDHPPLQGIVTADSLRANAPPLEVLQAHTLHSILGAKEGDQASVFAHVAAAEQAGRVTDDDRDDPATGRRQRCRFVSDVPLHAAPADLRGNFLAGGEWDQDQGQHCSGVTDLRGNTGPVYQLLRGGRARWRIENETLHTLKTHASHFEHHFGHGYQHLSVVFAVLRMWAFFVEQVPQLCCPLCQAVWGKLGSNRRLWERRRARFDDYALDAMRHLCEALFYG
jgi:hypothetical protein